MLIGFSDGSGYPIITQLFVGFLHRLNRFAIITALLRIEEIYDIYIYRFDGVMVAIF